MFGGLSRRFSVLEDFFQLLKGDYDQAIVEYESLAARFKSSPQVFFQLGLACLFKNDTSKALKSFNEAVSLDPNFEAALKMADELARRVSETPWTLEMTRLAWRSLVATEATFRQTSTPALLAARRAERLVLALDRLFNDLQIPGVAPVKLDELFKQVQALPDFDPTAFAGALSGLDPPARRDAGEQDR